MYYKMLKFFFNLKSLKIHNKYNSLKNRLIKFCQYLNYTLYKDLNHVKNEKSKHENTIQFFEELNIKIWLS